MLKLFSARVLKFIADFFGVVHTIAPYVQQAMPIVQMIAAMTPTHTDDAVLATYTKLGLQNVFDPTRDPATSIRDLAKVLLQKNIKDPVQDSILNAAVELAYSKYKMALGK